MVYDKVRQEKYCADFTEDKFIGVLLGDKLITDFPTDLLMLLNEVRCAGGGWRCTHVSAHVMRVLWHRRQTVRHSLYVPHLVYLSQAAQRHQGHLPQQQKHLQ
jgi:hypothetical protein